MHGLGHSVLRVEPALPGQGDAAEPELSGHERELHSDSEGHNYQLRKFCRRESIGIVPHLEVVLHSDPREV